MVSREKRKLLGSDTCEKKALHRDVWTSITSKKYIQRNINDTEFSGIIGLLYLQEVSQPSVWQSPYGEVKVCNTGMKWLQFLPENEHYLLTAKIDENNNINVFYIDVVADSGVEDDGVAFVDDLYLDVVVYSNGNILLDDRNELIMAFRNKTITQNQFELAQITQNKLLTSMFTDVDFLNDFTIKYLSIMEAGQQ